MADTVLTLEEIENIFQLMTAQILGLNVNSGVRIAWPPEGAPSWKRTESVAFIRVTLADDPICQQREKVYTNNAVNLDQALNYTLTPQIQFTVYGPNSFDNAELLRHALFLPENYATLSANNLYLITNVPIPIRAPELFNGQWWDRSDLTVNFNQAVTRRSTVEVITSVTAIVNEGSVIIEEG